MWKRVSENHSSFLPKATHICRKIKSWNVAHGRLSQEDSFHKYAIGQFSLGNYTRSITEKGRKIKTPSRTQTQ